MFTTNSVTQAGTQNSTIGAQSEAGGGANASDFESFLTLLTAQLRNQDPLSPLDSTQFVEQLASFSAVEQQIETNDRLENLASSLASSGLEGATQWIGLEIETESGVAQFSGEALSYIIPDNANGASKEVVVQDASGAIILQQELSAGQHSFTWNGETNSGAIAPSGNYAVSINYVEDGEVLETAPPRAIATVTEARLAEGETQLLLSNGALVEPGSLIAVRKATAPTGEE